MAQPTSYRVGGVPLSPRNIDQSFLKMMLKATERAEIEEGRDLAKRAVEELFEKGQMGLESLENLESYAKSLKKEWKADKEAIWQCKSTDYEECDLEEVEGWESDLLINAPFLGYYTNFTEELREATAKMAVQALAGAQFGPAPAVAGYAAYANGTKWSGSAERATQELIETYQAYQQGESPMITEGNSVHQVHREELWKTLTQMTRKAAESGDEPLPITSQYYELTSPEVVGNMAAAALAGSPLRLNLDAGRLDYPAKDSVTEVKYYEVDDLATKMRTVFQLTSLEGADVGISLFPSVKLLGSPTNLMHRKVLRVGNEVLMSGMNGNVSSGENIDAGYVVEGPAAKRFSENVARDIQNSIGAGFNDIWGETQLEKFQETDLRMGVAGLVALFDCVAGPSAAGTPLEQPQTVEELSSLADQAGLDLTQVLEVEPERWESTLHSVLHEEGVVSLSDEGKNQLLGLMRRGVEATQEESNVKALRDISLPSGKKVGSTRIDIADLPAEREVLTINAIQEAEEFIYIPGFVVTRAVAAAIVARQEQAKTEGKSLDIRVIADSGVYPFGGTPNSWGVNYLEEHGIPVRWSKLERTGSHDRKVHAKQILTDKGEIAGSTNFSKKGMRDNWETSAYVHFEEGDAEAQALKAQSKAQFEELWDKHTYPLSTLDLAKYFSKNRPEEGHEFFVESARGGAIRQIITAIENYEVESGVLVQQLLEQDEVSTRRDQLLEQGYSDGDAILMAVNQVIGEDDFQALTSELPTSQELDRLQARVEAWKEETGL